MKARERLKNFEAYKNMREDKKVKLILKKEKYETLMVSADT